MPTASGKREQTPSAMVELANEGDPIHTRCVVVRLHHLTEALDRFGSCLQREPQSSMKCDRYVVRRRGDAPHPRASRAPACLEELLVESASNAGSARFGTDAYEVDVRLVGPVDGVKANEESGELVSILGPRDETRAPEMLEPEPGHQECPFAFGLGRRMTRKRPPIGERAHHGVVVGLSSRAEKDLHRGGTDARLSPRPQSSGWPCLTARALRWI